MDDNARFAAGIHQRLLMGDYTASSELIAAYLPILCTRLQHRHPEADDESLLVDAATDSLLDYCERPAQFDPAKARLLGYLTMAAERDLLNALEKRHRLRRRQMSTDSVEDDRPIRNALIEDSTAVAAFERVEDDRDMVRLLTDQVSAAVPDARDRQIVRLMLDGERDTTVYARVLGIEHRGRKEQERIVKRNKDRLKKRLERLGKRLRDQTN
jgi:hypothetical protein